MRIDGVYLPDIVGKGYKTFWEFRGRYRVCKGSRASKKSKTTALWFIVNLIAHPQANLLVVRKTYRTLKDSCYTELKWAMNHLGIQHLWDYRESPLEMTYKHTGQKIYFRGLDDPMKITSITVNMGSLCWMWIEEAYEITSESDFNMLDESIRGQVPNDLFNLITIWISSVLSVSTSFSLSCQILSEKFRWSAVQGVNSILSSSFSANLSNCQPTLILF